MDLDAAEVRLVVTSVAMSLWRQHQRSLFDRWGGQSPGGNNSDFLRHLYESNKGLVVSRDSIQFPGDLRTTNPWENNWEGPSVLLLRGASSNDSFQIPDGFSAVAISADRNLDGDGPEGIESFTLYLISDDSSEVRAQEFDLDGIAEQESITLTGVEIANAELRLGLDLDNNQIIGASNAIQVFDPYSIGSSNGGNSKRYLIATDEGLVVSRDRLGDGGSGEVLVDLRDIAGRHANSYDGPGAVLLSNADDNAFSLQEGQTVQGVSITRRTVYDNAGIGDPGGVHEVFSGFELYLNDGNTTSLLSFDFTGQLDSTQTLSEDERFAREISCGIDLNGDGITGILLTTEVVHGRPLSPQDSYPMGRSRFAYEGNDGIVLTRHRLEFDTDVPTDDSLKIGYNLGSQNNNYSDIFWPGGNAAL